MKVKLFVHGALARAMPEEARVFECEAETPAEALRALFSQFNPKPPSPGKRWRVTVAGCDTEAALHSPIPASGELHILPAFMGTGGGRGGFTQIIIAVVLIVVAAVLSYFAPPAAGTFYAFALSALAGTGVSLLVGGLIQLLSPQPKTNAGGSGTSSDDVEASRYLGGARNTVESGTRIPIPYGKLKLAGHYIHFDIEAEPAAINGQPPRADQRRLMGSTVA